MTLIKRLISLAIFINTPLAGATCYKVTSVGSATTTVNQQIRPGEGVANAWGGARDATNGSLGLPSVINVSDPDFEPYPSLIASSVTAFNQYGSSDGYSSEQVFYRCNRQDAVYEMFSTNADNFYSGWYQGGDSVGRSIGLQSAYRTAWPNVLLRLTHLATAQYFTDVWKERLLTGLDVDSRGFKLVKAKNLSAVRAELFSAPTDPSGSLYSTSTPSQPYAYAQSNGYIAIKGPGIAYPNVGLTHYGNYAGFPANWPGALGLYGKVTLKRYPTCAVITATPNVTFPTISISELNAGGSREVPFDVYFKCQMNATFTTGINGTALGFKIPLDSFVAAARLGLTYGGVSYLLSDRYGQPGIAGGVGIRLLRDGSPMNLLVTENSAQGSSPGVFGWYPAIGNASNLLTYVNGSGWFRETFKARLEKLTLGVRPPVTAGRVEATAQVVIRVQ